ncbi:hypothetical protein H0H87_009539 [Tephrocybe sp. NHM501043]|nr:hypothetical protein H0H87_009539 [Tephrocybe sp. NHM501043]
MIRLVFISEITARAFIVADANKRRTLSRSDIAKALSKSDQFDFLIDIVPRDDLPFGTVAGKKTGSSKQPSDQHAGTSSEGLVLEDPNAVNASGSQVLEQLESLLNSGPSGPSGHAGHSR